VPTAKATPSPKQIIAKNVFTGLPLLRWRNGGLSADGWQQTSTVYPRVSSPACTAAQPIARLKPVPYPPPMIVRRPSGFIEPCLPSKVARPPLWVHEIKHDGYRLMVRRDGARVRCFTKGGHDWADRFPAIVDAAQRLKAQSFLIDGEAVIARDDGTPDFHALRSRRRGHEAVLFAFDLIEHDGDDLRDLPLIGRKRRLARDFRDEAAVRAVLDRRPGRGRRKSHRTDYGHLWPGTIPDGANTTAIRTRKPKEPPQLAASFMSGIGASPQGSVAPWCLANLAGGISHVQRAAA
jgi:hypothetical protein